LARAIHALITDAALGARLAAHGRLTALNYDYLVGVADVIRVYEDLW
jgi:hypothetical protein